MAPGCLKNALGFLSPKKRPAHFFLAHKCLCALRVNIVGLSLQMERFGVAMLEFPSIQKECFFKVWVSVGVNMLLVLSLCVDVSVSQRNMCTHTR